MSKFSSTKKIVIVSSNDILFNAINDYLQFADQGLKSTIEAELTKDSIALWSVIDLLIIDEAVVFSLPELYKVKSIISCIDVKTREYDFVKIAKPYKLKNIISIILDVAKNSEMFRMIGNDIIFDERASLLKLPEGNIKLTPKEREAFKFLLTSEGNWADKDRLLEVIWKYSKHSETTTVDTHLYNLKAKLPDKMLEIKGNKCFLRL